MKNAGKIEYGLKVFKILNERSEVMPKISDYIRIDDPDEKRTLNDEFNLLSLKYKHLRLKTGEIAPAFSRVDNHLWYIRKDKFGIMYFLAVKDTFEKKFVLKLQNKIRKFIEFYYEDLNSTEEKDRDEIRTLIEKKIESFNSAISGNGPGEDLMPSEDGEAISKHAEDPNIDLEAKEVEEVDDPDNYFTLIDKRNEKLLIVQIMTITCMGLSLLLAIIDLFIWMGSS